MKLKAGFMLSLLSFCANAAASGYFGIGYGETDYDADSISTFDDPSAIEFHLGFESSENLAFELGVINFGEADDGIPPEWHLEADSIALSLLAIAPVGDTAEVFFQFGLHIWDIELTQDGFGVLAEDDGNDFFYGMGANVNFTEKFGLGIRYNNYDFDGDDVTRFTINARLNFN